ncbi:hypothetical protein O181_018460 [Austropuccinia psidii MF-1]|uniref:Uncharacterized protein n=1 Tax=Austropuccinia psidii MF-1 TaxID=1389203 RepID=A0A9Q3C8T2_9BASI|nr:hypothetical protein [Austropuccinia psidii MF-1]
MKNGNGKRTFALGLIVTHGIQMPKTKPTESPATRLSCFSYSLGKTPPQPTPGPSSTQWSEDLFHEPSQHNEPPFPGPLQASDSQLPLHEKDLTSCPATPHSFISIDDMPVGTPGAMLCRNSPTCKQR